MASKTLQTVIPDQDDKLYTIEASVVTGFEESARGEAREKFGTDVKAARGKITWKSPLNKIQDVLKMGSVDNCRVVVHSVPHFKYADQHESLACLQKMVKDVDWESGLTVWNLFHKFPHPIVSTPDSIPSDDALVDVVIATRQPPPRDKSVKKNKNKGWGKKKGKKMNEDGCNKNLKDKDIPGDTQSRQRHVNDESLEEETLKLEHCESSGKLSEDSVNEKGDGNAHKRSGDSRADGEKIKVDADIIDTSNAEPDNRSDYLRFDNKSEDKTEGLHNKSEDKIERIDKSEDKTENQLLPKLSSADMEKSVTQWPEPKVVVIKRGDKGNTDDPKIDIRVVMPENVFPTTVNEADHRDVEPMECESVSLDHSTDKIHLHCDDVAVSVGNNIHEAEHSDKINLKVDSHCLDLEPDKNCAIALGPEVESTEEITKLDKSINDGSSVTELCDDRSVSPRKISESEFASIVIKKLISPVQSPSKEPTSGTMSPSMSCVTPPPTPIRSLENPFSNHQDKMYTELLPFLDDTAKASDRDSDLQETQRVDMPDEGSSLDPPLSVSEDKTEAESISMPFGSQEVPPLSILASAANEEKNFVTNGHVSDSVFSSPVKQLPKEDTITTVKSASSKKEHDPTKPTFRVTCNRTGECHSFDSTSAAASFGSAIITYFNWQVDLKNFDIEVILNIDNEEVTVCLALTKSSLHYRNLVAFGATTLRATICYNMLRLCRIKNGDFICDPMCGSSAIPIEGAVNWTNCYHFCGDFHDKAIEKTAVNIAAIQEKIQQKTGSTLKLNALQWDVRHLPLRDGCVDVFVSDLPFGHRLGSKSENRYLYPNLLCEMARTARTGARACLLTEDKNNLIKAVQTLGKYWQRRLVLNINIGGLSAFVFLLTRTTIAVTESPTTWRMLSKSEIIPKQRQNQTAPENTVGPDSSPREAPTSDISESSLNQTLKEIQVTYSPVDDLNKETRDTASQVDDLTKGTQNTSSPGDDLAKGRQDTSSPGDDHTKETQATASQVDDLTKGTQDTSSPCDYPTKDREDTSSPGDDLKKTQNAFSSGDDLTKNTQDTPSPSDDLNEETQDTFSPVDNLTKKTQDTSSPGDNLNKKTPATSPSNNTPCTPSAGDNGVN